MLFEYVFVLRSNHFTSWSVWDHLFKVKAFVFEATQINLFVHGIWANMFKEFSLPNLQLCGHYYSTALWFSCFHVQEDWILFFYFSFIAFSYARIAIIHPRKLLNCSLVNSKFTEDSKSKFEVEKRINKKKDQRKNG